MMRRLHAVLSFLVVIAFAIVAAFVLTSGVRGVAWVSVLKDFLLLFAASLACATCSFQSSIGVPFVCRLDVR